MSATEAGDLPRQGLRERKKARTRALIQQTALRLFREQGYDGTTVEQIAEAAEVSPSTVFNYFPTKPDLVIYDDMDDRMIEAFRAQPAELNAVQALRGSLTSGFVQAMGEELESQIERERLMRQVPELRAAMLDEFMRTLQEFIDLIAERTGRPREDDGVVMLAGAVMGLAMAAWLGSQGDDWVDHFLRRIDVGLEMLETGFDL